MQSRFGYPGAATRYLITQSNFDAWANATKPRNIPLLGVLLVFVATACSAAVFIMGPRLAREGALLWFGTYAKGNVTHAELTDAGKFKGGDPKYRLRLAYDFPAADGKTYSGVTQRDDVRAPPDLKPGDRVGVYYSRSNPQNSVAEHRLRTDVYALALFLPWIAFFGILGPLFYFHRWRHWRRNRGTARHAPHITGV